MWVCIRHVSHDMEPCEIYHHLLSIPQTWSAISPDLHVKLGIPTCLWVSEWSKDHDTGMNMLSRCCRHLVGFIFPIGHAWQTIRGPASHPTSSKTCFAIIQFFRPKLEPNPLPGDGVVQVGQYIIYDAIHYYTIVEVLESLHSISDSS